MAAREDDRIIAAAIVGSGARDAEDAWSDIDLALRLGEGLDPHGIADDWTTRMYDHAGAVDHLDVWSDATLFRVFLLSSSLQVDLSFWASDTFAASGGSFRLLFGESNEPRAAASSSASADLIGTGWLYALHVRSSIARGRTLQALHMINGVRDQVISLACLRHQLPARHGRGVDDLPADLRENIAETLVRGLDETELRRAFAMSVSILLDEAQRVDPDRAQRLRGAARKLVHIAT
ncbi:MAG: hypothetical protein MSC31_16415 [Solirubrobacteraceae bacterium MAG38_C4-C5]|nr:hypothetical protein [Candidatus Siliceabacter maunaloa]